ncbi:glycosyltransferase [Paenibacillus tengchongensis]|uniref:glycosyltransferase n=1 Tax=Paenibacillus tengchongensis TaxID=2608684 RepID=UPI00124F2DA2|nr:glycosyltransferase [Paenibacillus tengchongensis]
MNKAAGAEGVSVIVCTNRPRFFENLVGNFRSQKYKHKELIIILNKDSMKLEQYVRKVGAYPDIKVFKVPEKVSLGQCLNCGITKARYPLIAKFDDDDFYSPYYLREQVRMLKRTGSDIVGKHACLVYLSASRQLIIRSPHERDKPVVFVQGGTILFRRKMAKQVLFPDRSIGEDVNFLRQCERKGFKAYATSPYNYVYMRRANKQTHTWRAGDKFYLKGSIHVAVTDDYRRIATRKV